MSNTDSKSVPTQQTQVLAERLEQQAQRTKRHPLPQRKVQAGVVHGQRQVVLVIDTKELLEACGPRHGSNHEGATITAEGEFEFELDGKRYRFRLHMPGAWARIDMVVGGR